jgi:hypothetical protein
MKRIVIFVLLVMIAGVAGVVVRSSSHGTVAELRELVSHNNASDVHQEIRQSYELSPGARVELSGLNGAVKIETSDTNKAEVFIERTAGSQEALDGRKVVIDADANSLRIHGEKCDGSFLTRIFGSSAGERVTLKLPRQIALYAKGVNGAFVASDIDGAVEVSSINGRVQIGSALGRATFKGINGNMIVGLKKLDSDGVTLNGINGNIELQLASCRMSRSIKPNATTSQAASAQAAPASPRRELTATSASREQIFNTDCADISGSNPPSSAFICVLKWLARCQCRCIPRA